jgi:hypothetical protein
MLVVSLEANLKTFHGVWEHKLEFQSLLKLLQRLEQLVQA